MGKRLLHYARSAEWAAALEHADAMMAQAEFRAVKDEAKTRAGFLTVGGRQVFIKRFTTRSWAAGAIERLRGSRARRSLTGASLLGQAGFAHPAPLAALDLRRAGAVQASYLLSEALGGAETLSRFVSRSLGGVRRDFRWRREVSRAVADEIRRLHQAGLYSSDLQETNLLVEPKGNGFRVYFVDLDGFRRSTRVPWRRRVRNLVQLDRSVGRFLSRVERLRFLYDYLGGRPERGARRRLVTKLLELRRRKEREYRRRRAQREAAGERRATATASGDAPRAAGGSSAASVAGEG